jgi:small-conductance mechanosensitive channel
MKFKQDSAVVLLVAAIAIVAVGIYRTGQRDPSLANRAARRTTSDRSIVVDQSSLITAEQLVRLPTMADERQFALDALRLADQEMDLAFAQAVRQTTAQQRPLSAEAHEIAARLTQAERTLAADQSQVTGLTAAAAMRTPATAQATADQLNLAKAQAALDQDEVDDAKQDLRRAGGDPQGRMQQMIQEHDAASRSSDSIHVNVTTAQPSRGLINHLNALQALYSKESQLKQAKNMADSLAEVFKKRHDRLEARANARRDSANTQLSHDSSTALLAMTQRRALDEKSRAALDQRVDNQHRLSDVYASWMAVIVGQERAVINLSLRGAGAILAIVLVGLLLFRWMEHLLGGAKMDRRRTQTLYMVTRVSLQVIAVLFILLVVFGPPDNLGTFLGLAGAGLTVALKDFIVGFIGWFVLMGKDGIRIGDLVEVNGVTGEVVELGLFYTVLLETGSWNESGHPTGRRVTFMNGFAIEGHYFNFSTSGQWLWDEVRIAIPSGRDPQELVEAIEREVEEATADSARQAEAEWKGWRRAPQLATLSATPAISLKPTSGGVELIARYITRASERAELRTRLYHIAVALLGGATPPPKAEAPKGEIPNAALPART